MDANSEGLEKQNVSLICTIAKERKAMIRNDTIT